MKDLLVGRKLKTISVRKSRCLHVHGVLVHVGKKFDIIQTKRNDWLSHQNKTVEQLIDKEFLKSCKDNDIWDIYTVNETMQYIKGHGGPAAPGSSERYYV